MEKYTFTAPSKIEAINKAKKTLVETENNLIIKTIKETEEEATISVVEKREILNFIKEYLQTVLKGMGYNTINIEITNKEMGPTFTIYSDNDSMLIGKSGRNLQALQTLTASAIKKQIGESFKFILNINDYKERREQSLIKLTHNIAHEVSKTKIDAKLDSMNSYERRIIHNALLNSNKVYTESEGMEPNRYVVIKAKEDK